MRRLVAALILCLVNISVRAEECVASVYAVGDSSQPGAKTASGIPLNDNVMTAAPQIASLWFHGQGNQQEEWSCRHRHDHGPRTVRERPLH